MVLFQAISLMQRENTVAWNRLFESGYETEKFAYAEFQTGRACYLKLSVRNFASFI